MTFSALSLHFSAGFFEKRQNLGAIWEDSWKVCINGRFVRFRQNRGNLWPKLSATCYRPAAQWGDNSCELAYERFHAPGAKVIWPRSAEDRSARSGSIAPNSVPDHQKLLPKRNPRARTITDVPDTHHYSPRRGHVADQWHLFWCALVRRIWF